MISIFRPQDRNKTWPDGVNVDWAPVKKDPMRGHTEDMMAIVISTPDGEESVMVRKLSKWEYNWEVAHATIEEWRARNAPQ